jgi:hypothetical protein
MPADKKIYYVGAGDVTPITFEVTAGGDALYNFGTDHLPPGISVLNSSSDSFQITVENIDIPDEELPASYGISFNATSNSGPESHADIIFVIEPRAGQRPSILFDSESYAGGDIAKITLVNHQHIDCYVYEAGAPHPELFANMTSVDVGVVGQGFAGSVQLTRDDYSTGVFRGQFVIPNSASSGPITVRYPATEGTGFSSPCLFPGGEESAEANAYVSVAEIAFNSTVYTRTDETGEIQNTDGLTLTVVDNSPPLIVSATIEVETGAEPGSIADSLEGVGVVRVGEIPVELIPVLGVAFTYRYQGTIEDLLLRSNLATTADFSRGSVTLRAIYDDSGTEFDPEASATVFAERTLSFVVPEEGRSFYVSNDTAILELIDPVSNTNLDAFDTTTVTLCSYNASSGLSVVGGRSLIPLMETGRDTGTFVSGYQLGFINASFNVNQIPDDPSEALAGSSERQLFQDSHIRVLINQSTQVVAIAGFDGACWSTIDAALSSLEGIINTSFMVERSEPSDPDSGGRGQNVGAFAHADPPLATAAQISCSLYGGDTDKDGLCNNWETSSGLKVWYPSGSANFYVFTYVNDPYPNPNHKDLLIEVDHVNNANGPACSNTVSYKPSSTAITNIKNAFNKANIPNPDSIKGIKLHIYYASGGGEEVKPNDCVTDVSIWYDVGAPATYTFDEIKKDYFGSSTERASTDRGKAKWQAFHYCLFIPKQTQDTSSSGVAEQLGNDCVVSLGIGGYFDNSVDEQQGTLMHELGHNLGLYHGGPAVTGNDYNINCKPNYPSVMSYIRQTTNPYSNASLTYSDDIMDTSHSSGTNINSIDPNEIDIIKLSASSSLSFVEIVWGINSGAIMAPPADIGRSWADIDWNNTGIFSNSDVPFGHPPGEVNMLGISGCTSGDTVNDILSGADDWQSIEDSGNMNFREKNADTFETGFYMLGQLEPNTNTSRQIRAQFVNTTNYLIQNITNCTDPAFDSDQASYEVGDEIEISIADADFGRSNIEDFFDVRVFSDSDLVGLELTAEETGENTGIFEVGIETSESPESGAITVSNGDDVTIKYPDECSQDVSAPRDFSFSVGIDHVASTNVTKGPILGPGKSEFEERLVLGSDSVRMLVLNQSGAASERASVEKAIEELKELRKGLDGFDGGNRTDDSFKESQKAVKALAFLTDAIRSLQFAIDIPYKKEPFEITSLDLDCDGGEGCTITGYSDSATSTVGNFHIDPDKERMTFHGTGQGDLILQGSTDIMPIKNLQSAITGQDFEFEAINSTAVLLKDLSYNFEKLAVFYGPDLVSPSPPMLRASDGSTLHQGVNGSQTTIAVELTNYELALNLTDFWRNFTSIIEIRNEDDFTVFLGWQTGILEPDSIGCELCKTEIGLSWTPNELGNFTIRTFVVSDLEHPRILSGVKETSIMVVDASEPSLFTDRQSYELGETVRVTIRDPDANLNPDVDEVLSDIRIFSDSDRVGESFDAEETGDDTAIFMFTFETTSAAEAGKVLANVGDSVTIVYTDDDNNDFSITIIISDRNGPGDCRLVVCP